uniref:docking protein 2-like n=1 Tax=Pristiophorus japonicus TaxID=55135 RepID=UPI00398F03BF
MEEVLKQGALHVQLQQTFGKKWRKVWALLYGESTCSVARLEYFEFKEGVSVVDRQGTRKMENKKVIKLSDCIRITEAPAESCPSDCRTFHLETIEKLFAFAVESAEYEAWSRSLCEMAFPMNWSEWPMLSKNDSMQWSKKVKTNLVTMEENTLYSTRVAVNEFRVSVRKTEAAERCQLRGIFLLKAEKDGLELKDLISGEVLYTWPYRFLRRFGRDKVTFSFEAGRRCASGEGNFEFDTRQGNGIFKLIESAIKMQRQSYEEDKQLSSSLENETHLSSRPLPIPAHEAEEEAPAGNLDEGPQPAWVKGEMSNATLPSLRCLSLEPACDTKLAATMPWRMPGKSHHGYPLAAATGGAKVPLGAGAKGNLLQLPEPQSTYAEVRDAVAKPSSRKGQAGKKPQESQCAAESEYATPFDAIAKTLCLPSLGWPDNKGPEMAFSTFLPPRDEQAADPLYDTIDESNFRSKVKAAEPACFPRDHIYDEPEGVATPSVYDNPEEVKGHAWKLQGLDCDPQGHEYPYNPNMDDYAVPKATKQGLGKKKSRERLRQKDSVTAESEYDNVLVKILEKKTPK